MSPFWSSLRTIDRRRAAVTEIERRKAENTMMTRRQAIAAGAAIAVPGVADAAAIAAPPAPLLGPIRAVTTTAADLAAVQAAYETVFGYRVVEHGAVSAETA